MKSNVKDGARWVEYPCLMVGETGSVVLFSKHGVGIAVGSGANGTVGRSYQLGHYSNNWQMDRFTPFIGTVELTA